MKKHSAKHNGLKHLRVARFAVDTDKGALARWISELDGPDPNADNKHSYAVAANNRDRLPGPWENAKRRKIGSPDSYHQADRIILPPMRDKPESKDDASLENSEPQSGATSLRHEGISSDRPELRDANGCLDGQAGLSILNDLPMHVSFDNFLAMNPGPFARKPAFGSGKFAIKWSPCPGWPYTQTSSSYHF